MPRLFKRVMAVMEKSLSLLIKQPTPSWLARARTVQMGEPTAAWWVQLSTAIIFGLGFSTLLTLVLVPVLLTLPDTMRRRFGTLRRTDDLREALSQRNNPAE